MTATNHTLFAQNTARASTNFSTGGVTGADHLPTKAQAFEALSIYNTKPAHVNHVRRLKGTALETDALIIRSARC